MKKIIKILLLCLIIVGIVCMATLKFNIGLKYSANVQIGVNIGKDFNLTDIKSIAQETFGTNKVSVQYIELYKDMVQITVKEASDEQIEQLNTKINEKYEVDNKVEDIEVTRNEQIDFKSLIKPYLIPLLITFILILIYACVVFFKVGIFKVIYTLLINLIGSQAVLLSIYAITRLPINNFAPIIAVIVYIVTIVVTMFLLEKEKEEINKTTVEENK